jgi:DNA-binding response OmpR family regulator
VNLGAGPDGWEIAERARALNSKLPVVYMTGASGGDWKSKGVSNSILLAKPFTPDQIVRTLLTMIRNARTN